MKLSESLHGYFFIASSPTDKILYCQLTENRTGVRLDEICMAHPVARAAMTFPNTWLNECLHSVKKIDQWVRSEGRSGGGGG